MVESDVPTLFGNYRVIRLLGRGGMGSVYEVEHVRLGVRYALKAFAAEGESATFLRKRFLAEGRILARIVHPRLVRVYDMDISDASAWFTMDYVVGPGGKPQTLADVPHDGELSEATLKGWYADLCEALAVIHAAGIVHRDIKLENVLLGPDGRAVLSDFGISRVRNDELRRELELTRTIVSDDASQARVVGTVAYLAPEIRLGAEPTAATDLYALGVLFFRLLTGIWFEPGPHAFDLLAPYDRQWRTILGALLEPEPKKRQMISFVEPRRGAWRFVAAFLLAFALVGIGWAFGRFLSPAQQPQTPSARVAEEDHFAIPVSLD